MKPRPIPGYKGEWIMFNKKRSNRISQPTLVMSLIFLGSLSFAGLIFSADRTVLGELFTATW